MKSIFFVSILFLFSINLNAQTIKGVVLDKNSNKPIPFVSIGIINTAQGVYAYTDGRFEMTITDFIDSDSLRFSCIGYEPVTYSVIEFLDLYQAGIETVFLTEKIIKLEEVIIKSKRNHSKDIGNKISKIHGIHGFITNLERGLIIENKEDLFFKSVIVNLTMHDGIAPDSAVFRMNIYTLKNGLPYENILYQPIYFYLKNDQFEGINEFDISKYNITISDDFAVTFELVKKIGGSQIYFTGRRNGNKTVWKRGIQGKWLIARADLHEPGDNLGAIMYQCLEIEVLYEK
jgi:hypothetical protein